MKQKFTPLLLTSCSIFLAVFYTVWTYALTDPNLVLTSWAPYWNAQQVMWGLGDGVVAGAYALLISGMFGSYAWLLRSFFSVKNGKGDTVSNSEALAWVFPWVILVGLGAVSYNALSHDVFNYIFNARMVVQYGADPHVRTALEFASRDDWVRFMHNVHTPAPYWYGWTGLSLLPYLAGLGKFITTWLSFKAFSAVGLGVLVGVQIWMVRSLRFGKHAWWGVLAFAFNPLVLVELVSNAHNDAWMMAMALGCLAAIRQISQAKTGGAKWGWIVGSALLLLGSISQKYVTVVLLPLWVWMLWEQCTVRPGVMQTVRNVKQKLFSHQGAFKLFEQPLHFCEKIQREYAWEVASGLLFLPLLTARSQHFHPWYLVWSLSFLPFIRRKWWRNALLILSVSSMFRYMPWIANGAFEYTPEILFQQKIITWVPSCVFLATVLIKQMINSKSVRS